MARLGRSGGISSKQLTFVAGLAALVVTLGAAVTFAVGRAGAATCTDNDIIKCGSSSKSEFISTVKANDNGVNSQKDLQGIYARYGLSSADYDDFATNAVQGDAMRNGDIVVGGQTIATGGMSIGRLKSFQGSNPFTVSIGGHDYFGNVNDQSFADGVSKLSVWVLFDSTGTFKFAVLPSCGNPEFPKVKVKSSAACKMLNKTPVSGKANTYSFTADASATGLAKITNFVYDFGDGSATVSQTSGSTPVQHTYTTPGTFTAKVTVFATFPGSSKARPLPVIADCTKQVVVEKQVVPPAVAVACKNLQAVMVDDNKMAFKFTATGTSSGGPKLASGDFDFGDGNSQDNVHPDSGGNTVAATHIYATAGTFTARATLHFTDTDGKSVTADVCTATVTPAVTPPPTPPAPTPPAPQALPATGAGNVIALFSVATIVGFLGRQLLLRRHKQSD